MAEKLLLTEAKTDNYGDHESIADDAAYLDNDVSSDQDSEMIRSVLGGEFVQQKVTDQL